MFATRDVFALLLSCFAVYYSTFSEGVVSFDPAFVVSSEGGMGGGMSGDTYFNRQAFDDPTLGSGQKQFDTHTPQPVFFDLNGDGVREMIVAVGGVEGGVRGMDIEKKTNRQPSLALVEMHHRYAARSFSENGNPRATDSQIGEGSNRRAADIFGNHGAFHPVKTLATASLVTGAVRVTSGRNPIALAAGRMLGRNGNDNVDNTTTSAGQKSTSTRATSATTSRATAQPKPSNAIRKGVVVVVTEGWHVVCFDHNLNVLWEHALGEGFAKLGVPLEAAAIVTDVAVFEGDRGLVVIGGRSGTHVTHGGVHSSTDFSAEHHDPLAEELEIEHDVKTHRGGRKENQKESTKTANHFNYYAFETATGDLRWKHESRDFHRDLGVLRDTLTPQHAHKLDAEAVENQEGRHFGEASCREFRESFVKQLPHAWDRREDTHMSVASFHHHKRNPDTSSGTHSSQTRNPVARGTHSVVQKAKDGFVKDNTKEKQLYSKHFSPPNALVVKQEEGIEVVHLFSGRTLCKMLLLPHVMHADINGDGVIDHVSGRGGGDSEGDRSQLDESGLASHQNCYARATSGTPANGVLFEGSVCRGSMGVTRSGHKRRDSFGTVGADEQAPGGFISGNTVDVVSPTQILRGSEKKKRSKRKAIKDVLFLNSRGEVTSFSDTGLRRWQQRTDSGWMLGSATVASLKTFPLRNGGEGGGGGRMDGNNVHKLSGNEQGYHSSTEAALAIGTTRATFLTPSGYKLAVLKLPAAPAGTATIADVNGDGLNDLVLRTSDGNFYCWYQKSRVGTKPFSVLAGILVLTVGVTFVTQLVNAHGTDGYGYLVRSTEIADEGEGRKER